MSSTAVQLGEIAAQWRTARRIYAVYGPLARDAKVGPPSPELESPVDRAQPEALERVHQWLEQMDARVQAAQLRHLFQTTQLATEENLHDLIVRYLGREPKDESLRDKLDFLLVQYFSHCASPALHQGDVSLEDVAKVMKPVLGEASIALPASLKPLEEALEALRKCRTMRDLLEQGILERGRKVKTSAGKTFFDPPALLAFVRFNFLVRRAFFRLLLSDVHAIQHGLDKLESGGIDTVDCSRAQLSASEPVSRLRQLCRDWREPFRAPYAAGQGFRQLVDVRVAVEAALAAPPPPRVQAPPAVVAPPPAPPAPEPKVEPAPTAPVSAAPLAPPPPAPPEKQEAKPAPQEEKKPEPPPAPTPVKPAASKLVLAVEDALDRIAEQLLKNSEKKAVSVTSIEIGGSKLLLSSWEVAAFVEGGDELSDALQRAVAARAILVEVIAACRKLPGGKAAPGSPEAEALQQAVAAAGTEGVHVMTAVEDARNAKNIDAAVNLAATAKRLQGSTEEAKKLLS